MQRATFGTSLVGPHSSTIAGRNTMGYMGAKCNGTNKNNRRLVVPVKESEMGLHQVGNNSNTNHAGSSLKSLKNSINEKVCASLRSAENHVPKTTGEKRDGTAEKTSKAIWELQNEATKAGKVTSDSGQHRRDKLSLLRYILPGNGENCGLEKRDFEKEGNQNQNYLNIGCTEEKLYGKSVQSAETNEVTLNKIFDAVTLKNNLNTLCQMNPKTKAEKVESLLIGEHKICNKVSVVCMYFTKDSDNRKVDEEAHQRSGAKRNDLSDLKRSSSYRVASRAEVSVRDCREAKGHLVRDNSSSDSTSESIISCSTKKFHAMSKAMVCFPFNQWNDRSWCCVRSKRRKNRLRSRLPKVAAPHSSHAAALRRSVPFHGQTFMARQCGANTGESKGNGGASPGQQDSGESHSGRMPSRGGAIGGGGGGGGGGQRGGGGGSDERWWPPDCPDVPDGDEKDGVPEKNLNDVDKGGESSIRNELSLNISGEASLGSSSGGSTKAVAGGRCTSGELSDEDNNSALLLRQGLPCAFTSRSPTVTDGPDSLQPERKGSLGVHSRVAPGMVETALALFDPNQNFPSHVIQEMKPLRHSMFTEINKCLRHCFDKEYLATAFKCGMCLSLSAMIRHVGRCAHSRSRCKACDHVSNILKMHMRRCMLLERQSSDYVPQGTDSGSILTGFISSLLTSVPLACPIEFCVKLRKKLTSSRSGNHQAHLEMVWGKEDLWQRMKKMVASLYDIEVDYELDVPGEDVLDSLSFSLPVPSVTPSRMLKKTLIDNFKKGLMKTKKKKPEPPQKPKKIPPKIPPKPKFVLKKNSQAQERQEVKEKLVLPEVERRAKTSPRRRLLGAIRDSDITDDLYGPGAAAQVAEFGAAAGAAGGAAASGGEIPSAPPLPQMAYGQLQPQVPAAPHETFYAMPAPGFAHLPPPPPQDDLFQALMLEDEYHSDVADYQAPGDGQVEYGTVEDLHLFVDRVQEMRERYESGMSVKNVHEGIILEHMQHCLSVIEGRYAEGEGLEWVSIVHLGSGVTGRCWLIMDGQTHFQACVKRVDLFKFDKREVEVWSSLYHRQVADLYGVVVHENEVLMFAEFIDGGTLAEVIAKYAEDRVLYGETDDVVKGIDVQNSLFLYQQILAVLHYFMQPDVQVLHEDIKADNVMIRAETSELVLVDFGLARHLPPSGKVPGGESPSGAQTHWSPEKAASEGHSFPADWWAATCVLLECITTKPPWLVRYTHLKMLHFVIKMYSPPMEDVPASLDVVVRDLIQDAWTIDPNIRPPPIQQAKHPAFAKYGVPYMIEDDPDGAERTESANTSFATEHISSSGSSTITPQQSLPSDPTQGPQVRRKSDLTNSTVRRSSSGTVSSSTSPDASAQDSSEHTSDAVRPRLSVLLQPPSDHSPDNSTNPDVRPKTYDQPVTPSAPPAPPVLQSKSVEEEQQQLVGELLMQNMTSENPNFERGQEILENMSTSSKGEEDSASNHSDDLSLHCEPLPQAPVVGTLIEFRKINSDHLCSVRVKNLKQRWKDIIKTASVKIHTHYKDFTVFEDIRLTTPLRPDMAIGPGPMNRNVFVSENGDNWRWKCVEREIVYNQDIINGALYIPLM